MSEEQKIIKGPATQEFVDIEKIRDGSYYFKKRGTSRSFNVQLKKLGAGIN